MLQDPTKRVRTVEDGEREYLASLIHTDYEVCRPGERLEEHKASGPIVKGEHSDRQERGQPRLIFSMQQNEHAC